VTVNTGAIEVDGCVDKETSNSFSMIRTVGPTVIKVVTPYVAVLIDSIVRVGNVSVRFSVRGSVLLLLRPTEEALVAL